MALLRNLKQRDGLADTKGSLLLAIPSPVISMANCVVAEAMTGAGWQEACAIHVQEVQPRGAVSDRSIRLRPWCGSKLVHKSPFFDIRNW